MQQAQYWVLFMGFLIQLNTRERIYELSHYKVWHGTEICILEAFYWRGFKMSSEIIDVEPLSNFNRDLYFQQPKKDILYYVQIVPSHTSFSLILYLLFYVENQHKISRNLNKTREFIFFTGKILMWTLLLSF